MYDQHSVSTWFIVLDNGVTGGAPVTPHGLIDNTSNQLTDNTPNDLTDNG